MMALGLRSFRKPRIPIYIFTASLESAPISKMLTKLQNITKYIKFLMSFPNKISIWAANRPCRRVFILVIMSWFSSWLSGPAAIQFELACGWSMVIWLRKTHALPINCGWRGRVLQSCTSDPYEEATDNSPSESQPGRFEPSDEPLSFEADVWR